jgi:hypothetical protein
MRFFLISGKMMEGKCSVYFDPPFWVGIFEIYDEGRYQVARHVFGTEPNDPQLLEFARRGYSLLDFSTPAHVHEKSEPVKNYKRRMREIREQLKTPVRSTRSQEAIKRENESRAKHREELTREQRAAEVERKFQLHKERRAEKHRGH